MNGYELSRRWFDFAFENQDKVFPRHGILYFWLIELNNRLGWVENFKIPLDTAGAAIGIERLQTTRETLLDLVNWGFVKLVVKSPNQYVANVISLTWHETSKTGNLDLAISLNENCSSTVRAPFEQSIEHGSSNVHPTFEHRLSDVHIDKQLNNETIKPLNQETSADRDEISEGFSPPQKEEVNPPPKVARKGSAFDPLSVALPHGEKFLEAWKEWVIHRKQKKTPLTEMAVKKQLELMSCYSEEVAVQTILTSVTAGYQGLFPPKNTGNGKSNNGTQNTAGGVSPRLKGAWELLAENYKTDGS